MNIRLSFLFYIPNVLSFFSFIYVHPKIYHHDYTSNPWNPNICKDFLQTEFSNPNRNHFLFAYRITIENNSQETVQLLHRYWHIFDSNAEAYEVKGDGVVGFQPILLPGDVHEYESACELKSEIGRMYGSYTMQKI